MRVVRSESCESQGDAVPRSTWSRHMANAVAAREEELRSAMVRVIDWFGGDGPSCALKANNTVELIDAVAMSCFDLGRDDVLRKLVDPKLGAAERLALLDKLAEEHWDEPCPPAPKPVLEKEVVGYRVRDTSSGEPPYYAILADDNEEGFWWTETKPEPIGREDVEKLFALVCESDDIYARIVKVTRRKK